MLQRESMDSTIKCRATASYHVYGTYAMIDQTGVATPKHGPHRIQPVSHIVDFAADYDPAVVPGRVASHLAP